MASVSEYKCPACGGTMEFDVGAQKMRCPYCDTEISIDLPGGDSEQVTQSASLAEPSREILTEDTWDLGEHDTWDAAETAGMHVYSCKSCGAQIVAEETAGTATCPYCGNNVVMTGQFAGDLRPDKIIPFKVSKEQAKEIYGKFVKGKKFVPKAFADNRHIDEIKGVYVPYWFFDADVQADITMHASKITSRQISKNQDEITTINYEIRRGGDISFKNVPMDGSGKMDDVLAESIEPFNQKDAVSFKTGYLAGFMSDRYDVKPEDCYDRIKQRLLSSAESYFTGRTKQQYINVSIQKSSVFIHDAGYAYGMCPVWLLTTAWQGKSHLFAINGQTGKMAGELPFDKGSYTKYILLRGAAVAAAIFALPFIMLSI